MQRLTLRAANSKLDSTGDALETLEAVSRVLEATRGATLSRPG
jgi:hypothetical protein